MKCRICSKGNLEKVIDLGRQPWCNNFLKKEEIGSENFYPLEVVYCTDCRASQLSYTVRKEIMFSDHTYLSGVTRSLSQHFKNIASLINIFFEDNKNKSILDIGSNDGTQLKHYQDLGWDVLGVESSKTTSKIANENNIETIHSFFNDELAKDLNKKFDVINASGVFFHLEELHSVAQGIKRALKNKGIFVVQFLYMKTIMENNAFDQIYHEHLLYYTLETLQKLLNIHGLELFDAFLTPIHGGQMIGYVSHPGQYKKTARLYSLEYDEMSSDCNSIISYYNFQKRILLMKEENLKFLNDAKKNNKKVFGMGAPVKGNTLLNYFGIDISLISFLLEKNTLRNNLYSPGMHLPVFLEDEIDEIPDIYYVLAWNFKEEILKNNSDLLKKGVMFYFPINPKELTK